MEDRHLRPGRRAQQCTRYYETDDGQSHNESLDARVILVNRPIGFRLNKAAAVLLGRMNLKMTFLVLFVLVCTEAKRNTLDALARKPVLKSDSSGVTTQTTTQSYGGRWKGTHKLLILLVELDGLEPSTSSLRTRRSPN